MHDRSACRKLLAPYLVLVLGGLGCGGSSGGDSPIEPEPRSQPSAVAAAVDTAQTAAVGAVVPAPPALRVTDARGRPVAGVAVTFAVVSGGGAVTGPVATTSAQGIAAVASWTLGRAAGNNVLIATVEGIAPVTFTAAATPGPAAALAFAVNPPPNVRAGEPVAPGVQVEVLDAYANRVTTSAALVTLTLTGAEGGGALGGATRVAAVAGVATFTDLTVPAAGTAYALTAAAEGLAAATGTRFDAAPPAPLPSAAPVLAVAAGDQQSAVVGTPLAAPLAVTLRTAQGEPAAGVAVEWAVAHGGGALSETQTLTDAAGQARTSWTLGLAAGPQSVTASAAGAAPVTVAATAVADTEQPILTGLTITPRELNVVTGSAALEIRATITDAGAGVYSVRADYAGPAGAQARGCPVFSRPTSGTPNDGTWVCAATIPQHAVGGEWSITSITVHDRALNRRVYSAADLAAAGLPATFVVTSAAEDLTAPVLGAFSISPAVVDVTAAAQTVRFTATLRDDSVGVAQVVFGLEGPEQAHTYLRQRDLCSATRTAGTPLDGTWSCAVTIEHGSTPGAWTATVTASDKVHNALRLKSADLRAAGFPGELTVVSATPDVTAPALTGFSASPTRVTLSGGGQEIEFTITATDDMSGIYTVAGYVAAPGSTTSIGCGTRTPISGSAMAGTFRCRYLIPGDSQDGEWALSVSTEDVLRNRRTYRSAELKAMGLPATITITRAP